MSLYFSNQRKRELDNSHKVDILNDSEDSIRQFKSGYFVIFGAIKAQTKKGCRTNNAIEQSNPLGRTRKLIALTELSSWY